MKKLLLSMSIMSLAVLAACGGEEGEDKEEGGEDGESAASFECNVRNEVIQVHYDGEDQDFDQVDAYANYSKAFGSYRVMYLNYPKSEDDDFKDMEGDEQKIIVGIFNPVGGEFQPGSYTLAGDENGMNMVAVQVETSEGMKTCNYAGVEDPGSVEVTSVSEAGICGSVHITGRDFEIKATFGAKNEK